ncbi:hypothetical protein MLD38_021281 [Melastoma candidum]|uniref:Uncharacterized protein n=1 Tax=Melastoma candidum TaxID=119954 RepID=A0ACB9QJG9_9MYRT|nr:hypothetical protein MLD38_021281 [Melastoma candidum]
MMLQQPISLRFLIPAAAVSRPILHRPIKCIDASNNGPGGGSLKESVSNLVDEQVAELLTREDNRGLLDGLEKASQRVDKARLELAEIERQQLEAQRAKDYVRQLEARASEIAESQQAISEARAMVDEAERSLSTSVSESGDRYIMRSDSGINQDAERLESVKAALISALIGTATALPISFTQASTTSELLAPLSITFISCALFGVTFRYAVRRDLDNIQLKTGTAAAFGIVRGLGYFDRGPPPVLNLESLQSYLLDGAVYISESLIIFTFAAVALDFLFKMGILSPFPISKLRDAE